MPLELEFSIDQTDLILQQDATCRLAFKNTGDKPLSVAHPDQTGLIPLLRVVEVQTGVESTFRRDVPATAQSIEGVLQPGQTIEATLSLLSIAHLHLAGTFAISAVVPYNAGLDRAESAPVTVNVRPTTVTGLCVGEVHRTSIFAAWMNSAANSPDVVRSECIPSPLRRTIRSSPMGKASRQARPVLSVNYNKTAGLTHWVAWLNESSLEFSHYDMTLGPTPVRKAAVTGTGPQIVYPLSTDPPAGADRPAGAALLWSGDGPDGQLVIVDLTASGGRAGARLALPGARPRWIMSQFRSDRSRIVLFARGDAEKTTLHFAPWPDRVLASNPPRQLAEWPGRVLTGGSVITPEDQVLGVCYLHRRSGLVQSIERITWALDPKGEFSQTASATLSWTSTGPIDAASARVRPDGTPAGLIRDQLSGRWFVDTGYEDLKPLQLDPLQMRLPVELAFGGPGRDPILICAKQGGGLVMKQIDGSELPEHC